MLCIFSGRPTIIQGIVEIEELPSDSAEPPPLSAAAAWTHLSEQLLVQALLALSLYVAPWGSSSTYATAAAAPVDTVAAAGGAAGGAAAAGHNNRLRVNAGSNLSTASQSGEERECKMNATSATQEEGATVAGMQQFYMEAFAASLELYTPWADSPIAVQAQEVLLLLATHVPPFDRSWSSRSSRKNTAGSLGNGGGADPGPSQEQLQQLTISVLPLLQRHLQQTLRPKPSLSKNEEADSAGESWW
jgi:hypothetical protein